MVKKKKELKKRTTSKLDKFKIEDLGISEVREALGMLAQETNLLMDFRKKRANLDKKNLEFKFNSLEEPSISDIVQCLEGFVLKDFRGNVLEECQVLKVDRGSVLVTLGGVTAVLLTWRTMIATLTYIETYRKNLHDEKTERNRFNHSQVIKMIEKSKDRRDLEHVLQLAMVWKLPLESIQTAQVLAEMRAREIEKSLIITDIKFVKK